jgi:hypothetical protein
MHAQGHYLDSYLARGEGHEVLELLAHHFGPAGVAIEDALVHDVQDVRWSWCAVANEYLLPRYAGFDGIAVVEQDGCITRSL